MKSPFNSEAGGMFLIMLGVGVTILTLMSVVILFPWEVATIAVTVFICSTLFDKDFKQ